MKLSVILLSLGLLSSVSLAEDFKAAENVKAFFVDQFDYKDLLSSSWVTSNAKKESESGADGINFMFNGMVAIEEPSVFKAFDGDKGLVLKSKAQHHGVTRILPTPLDNKDKTLVLQYEVKLQDGLECGGAYIKLISKTEGSTFDPLKFNDKTPYTIMFGPDKCGSTDKVHFIFRHKNPITGEFEEKHLKSTPSIKNTDLTSLYTLIVRPDNTFSILINLEEVTKGSLLESFSPSVNPPKEIDDPNDVKPVDWVDDEYIVDKDAKRPEDWDETQPKLIPDENAVKPAGWLDDEPEYIPDPDAKAPSDWDEEEDGVFEAPSIPNPKCASAPGCGVWKRPEITNPKYKGVWTPPMIKNPAYKGPWAPRKIANDKYFEDLHPHNFEPMSAVGFEIWTMSQDILFDNIYIGFDEKEAREFAENTFSKKYQIESALKKEQEKETKKAQPSDESSIASRVSNSFKSVSESILSQYSSFIQTAQTESVFSAVKQHPLLILGFIAAVFTPFVLGIFLVFIYEKTIGSLPVSNKLSGTPPVEGEPAIKEKKVSNPDYVLEEVEEDGEEDGDNEIEQGEDEAHVEQVEGEVVDETVKVEEEVIGEVVAEDKESSLRERRPATVNGDELADEE